MLIVIDGGSASGKSTLAREMSDRFEIPLLESGSLYRSLTLKAIQSQINFKNSSEISDFVRKQNLKMVLRANRWYLEIDGAIFKSDDLRSVEVSEKVGLLARVPAVRKCLIGFQRSCYRKLDGHHLIAEGRDMGTVVFPKADHKVFLEVSGKERDLRRQKDFGDRGINLPMSEISEKESLRNKMDRERKTSPLKRADNAILIDTTNQTPSESYVRVIRAINRRRKRSNFIYWFLRRLTFVPRYYFKMDFQGVDNIPETGGFVIASNHASHADPVLLGFALKRPLSFMAKKNLFDGNFWFAWLLHQLNAYPINRDRPDRKTLSQFNHYILEGHGIVYFPEGTRTRNGELGPFKKGIGTIGVRTACPVIPAYIDGTYEAFPRSARKIKKGSVKISFGPPVDFSEFYNQNLSPQLYEAATDKVREAILDLKSGRF